MTPELRAQLYELTDPKARAEAHSLAVASDLLRERDRQINIEGWTAKHDDEHDGGELARAAACYASGHPARWPWPLAWWKPKDKRRNLVKAGALIIAEIERLDRKAGEA
jgi:hypothetical protein